ncbi:MAG: SdpI family protein [Ruminococcus sp.]|nr:SdpI family protein [Ruminococcus sp.]MCM1382537.1 SdpI family protein [Muribaculaceae bacterium]MCM1480507.1 SdpI family protein [Muribaculaceae bacterium]
MKNKLLKIIMFATALIPASAAFAALPFLPEKIPAHFDFNMNIDRWGSKYESLIMPAAAILTAAFMYGMSRFSSKSENGENNEKVMLISGIAINILFAAMTVCSLAISFNAENGVKINGVMLVKFIFISLGIVLAIVGNFMPKCRINSVVGLRTKWSTANENVWFKCQRFGGVLYVSCGILMIVFSAFFNNITAIFSANIIISILILIGSFWGSKIIYGRLSGKK